MIQIQDAFKGLRRYHKKNELVARLWESISYVKSWKETKKNSCSQGLKDQNILEYTNIERFITILNHAIAFQ